MNKYLKWVFLGIILLVVMNFSVKAYRGNQLKQKAQEIFHQHAKLLGAQASSGSGECIYDSIHASQTCYINYELSVPNDSKKFSELLASLDSDGWSRQSTKGYTYRQFFYERACDVRLEQNSTQLNYKLSCYH